MSNKPYTNGFIDKLIKEEDKRKKDGIQLIASENITTEAVRKYQGSIFTDKYAEGYPYARYYNGCEVVDRVEEYACKKATELFGANYANVQPHSGSSANMAVYFALLNHKDTVLGMSLDAGGHLTHGSSVSFSGKFFNFVHYGVDSKGFIDYKEVEKLAEEHKPKLIVAGASAYSRKIDFSKFKKIAKKVGALLMVDMAHIAGLVAAGLHQNPVKYADVVTSTTHKTLMGPRSGFILTNNREIIDKINKTVFPGIQGGPLMHVIAAKAACFDFASTETYKKYMEAVVYSSAFLAKKLSEKGIDIITGGTDNHLFTMDVTKSFRISGNKAAAILSKYGIYTNKNMIPNDTLPPKLSSGVRIGTAALCRRKGFIATTQEEMKTRDALLEGLANSIFHILDIQNSDEETSSVIKKTINKGIKDITKLPIIRF